MSKVGSVLKSSVRQVSLSTVSSALPVGGVRRIRGRAGMRRRESVLDRYPICAICEAKGLTTQSTIADHRIPLADGGADDESNLWGLCDECHTWKTKEEATRRAAGMIGPVPGLPEMKAAREPVLA